MIMIPSWPRTQPVFCVLSVLIIVVAVQVASLSGPNVCMVQQKYNITKRVKYRAPMSVRTYVWCFSIPPRCSQWKTEMRDLTRLETEERMAEVAVCCPGYKMKDISCIPICPNGKTGKRCTEACPPNKWGPNCVHDCAKCLKGFCSPVTGECECLEGWQGESCNIRMTTTSPPALMEELLTTTKSTVRTTSFPSTKQTINTSTELFRKTTITSTFLPTEGHTSTRSSIVPKTETTTKMTSTTNFITEAYNLTSTPHYTTPTEETKSIAQVLNTHTYNRTESSIEGTSNILPTAHDSTTTIKNPLITKTIPTQKTFTTTTQIPFKSTHSTTTTSLTNSIDLSTATGTVRKIEHTINGSSTPKTKPKEIWIKPTQKGMPTEFKIKINHDLSHPRGNGTKNEATSEITTPRTIIVSIIPTSVSHASFKKIALTTASYFPMKTNVTFKKRIHGDFDKVENGVTKSMSGETSTQAPFTIKILSTMHKNFSANFHTKNATKAVPKHTPRKTQYNVSSSNISTSSIKSVLFTTPTSTTKSTNRMLRTPSTSNVKQISNTSNAITLRPSTNIVSRITTKRTIHLKDETKYLKDDNFKKQESSLRTTTLQSIIESVTIELKKNISSSMGIKLAPKNFTVTESPIEDETFHILTEPEHITAVMSESERDRSSLDLISVVSVVGGIMMAVITVAVIIVMFERCRRPRYADVRKINDIRMQVMIDNNDVPPPYVRSIFHTPLPDPPSDKCHYQPISTLDRNLKQFMRPVVVQNISPIMLENFRGILECHYDHLPRRSHDIGISERESLTPSVFYDEKCQTPQSVSDGTIDSLKCEAKLSSIEHESSEPLYAEIPCWRPPSEHAFEVMNLNGEAVTEL